MKLNAALYKIAINSAWLALPFVAVPQTNQLSLKLGLYVREPVACKDAPNATIMHWDGSNSRARTRASAHHAW
jgi:hypothetical protein